MRNRIKIGFYVFVVLGLGIIVYAYKEPFSTRNSAKHIPIPTPVQFELAIREEHELEVISQLKQVAPVTHKDINETQAK